MTNLVWSDEFNGSSSNVDVTKWNFDIGNSSTIAGGGWGNQEKETYSSRTNNAFVANGLLHIVTINDQGGGAPYSSARLQTLRKFSMTYGRAEFRAKLPGNGLYWWPALWMLATNFAGGTNPTNHWPQCGEIDVCESKGSTPGDVLGTLHKDSSGSPGNDSANGGQYNFPAGDGTTNFHTYVLSWVSNSISFSVDNNAPYKTITSWSSSIGPYPTPFNHPFYIIMNLAVGGTFFSDNPSVATINANDTFPAEMDIDYVRVYQDVPPLLATGVSPTNGCMNGGTPITISGSNFLSGATVTIGGVPATSVVFVNTNTLTAVTPANSAGPMNVAVQMQYISPTGTNTLTATLTNAFTYTPGPSFGGLTSATPASNGATLTWSAASGTAPITYEVFEATSSGAENYASPVLVTNVTSVLVAPLSCSNTYFFVVRAVDGCGNTDGNTVEQSAPLSSGPAFAGLGSVIPATEAATLSWSAASGAPPVAYNVYEATASGTEDYGSPVLTTNSLSAFIAPLYPGSNSPITYFFVARAVDACNNSDTNTVERSIQPLLDPAKSQVNDGIPNGWKQQYGLNPFDPSVAAADPDGDGLSNLQEYLLGTDPTDKSSPFHVIAITQENNDLLITWADAAGRTNVVEAASDVGGTYSNISDNIIVPGSGLGTTNYLDAGAVTNSLSRFYRVRVVP
ncbi:MAG TPA: family 16 glycosylhydrolase [Verrucomicrobiae bacterium]|nr:family 16 glycosylhydrolase [Verrucomicrobiae bacterium]